MFTDIVNDMQPNLKLPFHNQVKIIIQSLGFERVLGCVKKLIKFFIFVFSKGSVLGFSFWYTVYVKLPYSHIIFIAPNSVRPLFFTLKHNRIGYT